MSSEVKYGINYIYFTNSFALNNGSFTHKVHIDLMAWSSKGEDLRLYNRYAKW